MAGFNNAAWFSAMDRFYSFFDFLVFDSRYRKVRLALALVIYSLVLILGSVPGARQEMGKLASGVVLHSLTYGFITVMLFGGLGKMTLRPALLSLAIVAALGALDEYVQSFFPYRTANVADWGIDVLSGLFSLGVLLVIYAARKQGQQKALR